jgi:DNA-binding response OmpR family regulator
MNQYKILIVDDEANIRLLIKKYASFEGFQVLEAENGIEAYNIFVNNEDIDLIIMDVMMPELDGFSTIKKIYAKKRVPVIMLTARGEEYDKILGFELGVDDYVVKPFSPKELIMRVQAVLRRSNVSTNVNNGDILSFKGVKIDKTSRKVFVNDQKIEMSLKEYELLLYLAENHGVAISREQFITNIWGYSYDGFDRTLDTHIKLLRKSLGEYAHYIETIRGFGYRFDEKN